MEKPMEATERQSSADIMAQLMGETSEPEEVQQEATNEVTEEVTEEVEQETNQETQETDSSQDDESQYLTTDDLSQYFGIESDKLDVAEDGIATVKVKINGEESTAKLSDLIKSYQLEGHLNSKNMEVAEQKKALDAKQAELDEQYKGKLEQADVLLQIAQGELNSEFQSVDWNELEQDDPQEYAIKLLKFQQRQAQLNQTYQHVVGQKAAASDPKIERDKVYQHIPAWKDQKTALSEGKAVSDYLVNSGLASHNDNITDHKIWVLGRKAMLYDKLESEKTTTADKIKKAPKLSRPGSPTLKKKVGNKQLQLVNNVKKTKGNRQAQNKALHELLMNRNL